MIQTVKLPLILLLIVFMMPMPALAYMGPGAGLTAFGALVALLAGIWYTFKGFLYLPLKRMLNKNKTEPQTEPESAEEIQTKQQDTVPAKDNK